MSDLTGQVGELKFTVSITRKETGKVETYELVGAIDAADLEKLKGEQDGGNALDSGA
jgi:hypothetical protein